MIHQRHVEPELPKTGMPADLQPLWLRVAKVVGVRGGLLGTAGTGAGVRFVMLHPDDLTRAEQVLLHTWENTAIEFRILGLSTTVVYFGYHVLSRGVRLRLFGRAHHTNNL